MTSTDTDLRTWVPATRDITTFLAWVILSSDDRAAVDADYRRVKAWEADLDIR